MARERGLRRPAGHDHDVPQPMTTDAVSPQPPASPPPPDAAGAELVPGWLVRLGAVGWRVLASVALLVVIALVAIHLATVTGAILVGFVVTATVYPLVQHLRDQRGWPRAQAAGAVSVLALIVVVVAIVLIALAFIPYVADIVRYLREGMVEVTQRLTELGVPEPLVRVLNEVVDNLESGVFSAIGQLVEPIAMFVTILILGGFLTFYLLEDGDRAWASATKELDDWRADQLTGRGLMALEQVGGYLRGTTVLAATDALTDWLFLTALGVPLAGPLAVLVFVGGFVPYLGGIVSVSVAALVALATQGIVAAAVLLALVGLMNIVENRYLAPRVFAPMVKVSTALAIVALPAGAALFGFIGLVAAVPVVIAVVTFAPAIVDSLGRATHPADSRSLVPVWLDRLGQWSWRTLVVLGLGWLIVQVAIVPFFSVPVVLALVMAAALSPVSNAVRQRGASPTVAALSVTVASIAIVVVVVALTIVIIARQLPDIVSQASIGAANLGLGVTPVDIVHIFGTSLIGTVTAAVAGFANVTLVLTITILLIFFFLRDGSSWWARIVARISPNQRERVNWTGLQSAEILRGTMVGTALVSLAGAILQWLTMAVLGLPLAFPIGVLAFFAGFIPYIGSFITTTLGFLVAVAVGEPIDIVLMFIFTIVFNIVQGNLVAPLVFGKTVSLHPAVVLLAAPAGAAIGGILGMVMVVPVVAIIVRTWRTVIHLFDPEHPEAAAAAAPSPAPPPEPPRRRRAAPAAGGAEP
jgi:putative heme transporter